MSRFRQYWPVLKWVLLAFVLVAVGWQGWKLSRSIDWERMTIRPGWLALATGLYILGWVPAIWFWKDLLRSSGTPVGWLPALRAYFCGHLGKYIPGKAGVVFIRAGMLQSEGVPLLPGALAAAYETLAAMAVGGLVGAALLPVVVPAATWLSWWGSSTLAARMLWVTPILVVLAGAACWPILSRLFGLVLRKLARGETNATDRWKRQPSWTAFVLLILGWWIHGLSMGCTIQCLSPDPVQWLDWPRWTAATTLSIVLGFLALFSPGGIGVREWILLELLTPAIGPQALIATVLSRFVWLVGECGAALLFYYWPRPRVPSIPPPP